MVVVDRAGASSRNGGEEAIVKQAAAPPDAKWTGPVHPGVKAPEPIRLPNPATRFVATAQRLKQLAINHPLNPWLEFLSALSLAQHAAVTSVSHEAVNISMMRMSVDARMPPLAADGHTRALCWRDGLDLLLDGIDKATLPEATRVAVEQLRTLPAELREALADRFLRGTLEADEVAHAVLVAAALQVYFTGLSARLPVSELRLLEERGLCPSCGSPPVVSVITATGVIPGSRYLHCSLCSTAWNHMRATCVTCRGTRKLSLTSIEGDSGLVKAETCGECHTYSKIFYQAQDTGIDPYADDLASLGLDILVAEEGFARHAPNPFLLSNAVDAATA